MVCLYKPEFVYMRLDFEYCTKTVYHKIDKAMIQSELNLKTAAASLRAKAPRNGFTLIELLVVIAIIAILASVLLPVLHQAQLRGQAAACIDHQKQMVTGWVMYSQDNNDFCAGNNWLGEQNWIKYHGKFSPSGTIATPTNWISGWMDPSGGNPNNVVNNGDEDNTNFDLLVDPSYASMGDYVKNPQLFICPSCEVKVDGLGSASATNPRPFSQIRSISMNCWVGFTSGPPNDPYKEFKKTSAITGGLNPVNLFVFMEERGESIDDGSF